VGNRYLTDLAGVVRAAGITVQEEPGWQTRARSSGGYDSGRPDHVMIHHTASGPSSDGQADVNYMCYSSDNRPIANLYLSRSGKVWVMAAGATNTNGSGRCPHCGTTDNMNSRAIGIEPANDGVGEPWAAVQQDVYVRLTSVLCGHYAIANAAVIAHLEYAAGRKIDPAGQSRYASGAASWAMGRFRADCAAGGGPPAHQEEIDVTVLVQQEGDTAVWVSNLIEKRWANNTGGQEDYVRLEIGKAGAPDTSTRVVSANEIPAYGLIVPGSPLPPPPPGYTGRDWLGRPTR
jgi:hypothetical protein